MGNTKHGLQRRMLLFSLPIISSLFIQQLYGVVDLAVIGHYLGADELAAVGNASNILMLFLVISGGLELAVEIVVSRYIGMGDEKGEVEAGIALLYGGFGVGLLFAVVGFFSVPALLHAIQLPPELMAFAELYAKMYVVGLPIIYVYDISRAILIAAGDAKSSFHLMLSSTILNVVLNILFIGGFGLGVAGSALGTVVAQGIVMVAALMMLHRKFRDSPHYSPNPQLASAYLSDSIRIALPTIFQQFVVTFSSVLVQALVNPFGSETILGFVAVTKVMMLARIVVIGLAQTLTIFGAQSYAGKRYSEVRAGYGIAVRLAVVYTLVSAPVLLVFAAGIGNLFFATAAHPQAFGFFREYLYGSVLIQLFSVFKFMNESLLRSALKMKAYLVCNIGELALKLGVTYLFLHPFGGSAFWLGEAAARAFILLLSFRYLRQMQAETRQS